MNAYKNEWFCSFKTFKPVLYKEKYLVKDV